MSDKFPASSTSLPNINLSSPVFHNDINKVYDEDWQKFLSESNNIQTPNILLFFLNLSSSFDTTSTICKQMNLSTETEFIALDYLESMLEQFLQDLTKAINDEANKDHEKIDSYWSESFKVFEKDVPLIIFLTVSIAAKYTDADTHFGLLKVQELVQKVTGEEYLLSDLKGHEFNLFKLMNFQVARPAALHSMEHFIKMVYDKKVLVGIGLGYFLNVGVLALRYAYLHKNTIYESLEKGISDRVRFKKFTKDKVLLGASVVYASKIMSFHKYRTYFMTFL